MKKQPKSRHQQPRRKPLPKSNPQKPAGYADGISQDVLDRIEAQERAMRERMSSAALGEYLRMVPVGDDDLLQADGVRLDEILEEYEERAPPEVVERPHADIARERK
jgi:hypothetical protein